MTHVAGYEGGNVALEIATGLPARVDWKALPRCTYTEPEIAQIGLTLDQARERFGNAVTVETQRFADNDRAIAEGAATGQLKLILKGRKVVGASIVGAHAGEMLLPISQMITGKASTFALGSAVVSYPTRSEIVKAAAFAAWEPIVFGNLARRYARLVARIRRLVA
jgi:pyruvate/2-oxoglutarate dehydrogenase complex dihydrolipoamide dehydrogenase (E3) component